MPPMFVCLCAFAREILTNNIIICASKLIVNKNVMRFQRKHQKYQMNIEKIQGKSRDGVCRKFTQGLHKMPILLV